MSLFTRVKKTKSDLNSFLEYVRNNRIAIHSETRKIGIAAALIGWALIACSTVHFQNSIQALPLAVNFFIQFFSGTLILFIASLFKGPRFLQIKKIKKLNIEPFHNSELPVSWRKRLIYFRSILAVIGYMALSWSASGTHLIDNSALFSADVLFYVGIFYWVFKEKFSPLQIWGIIIAFTGVCFVFSYDFHSLLSISTGCVGLFASLCLAIVFFLILVLVQHDYPLRIAFYQCGIGCLVAATMIIGKIAWDPTYLHAFPIRELIFCSISGILYAISLLFFFNAFLYTESILIAVLGYSLIPFNSLLLWTTNFGKLHWQDLISFLLISVGGILVAYQEYHKSKMKKIISGAAYMPSLVEKFHELKIDFEKGRLDQYDYMSKRHEFNKLLFEYSNNLAHTDINCIEITKDRVLFTLNLLGIKIETDGACRSAPFEMLNFGSYEPQELKVVCQLLHDGAVIVDIGAHIGFYSIFLAKKFPLSKIYAFEPIPNTFNLLEKNIRSNDLKNIQIFNYGLSNSLKAAFFYYFKGGSVLASQRNLINHHKTQKIKCHLKRLDDVVLSIGLDQLDFIKCDIEGGELAAIQGAVDTINQFLPIVLVELYEQWCEQFNYSANEVLSIFADWGYLCFSISNGFLKREVAITNEGGNYNYLFLHQEKHKDLIQKMIRS